LEEKGSSTDAVLAAVSSLEDCYLFNAGKGAVFTHKGEHEMDDCLMEGSSLKAAAVAGLQNIKNPILLCKTIMDHSGHVFLSGQGAQDYAVEQGYELMPKEYFFNQYRHDQWVEIRDSDFYQLDHKEDKAHAGTEGKKFGTVGAVALDINGDIAAATSTGGMTNKKYGRVGDSPVIGSGNYANNDTCAISCTGHGEFFLRAVVAYDISCLMEYKGMNLQQACDFVVKDKLVKFGGEGGLIAIDRNGIPVLSFNSEGMYRGAKTSAGIDLVAIYGV
jgi:L-asparaginase / beta-aspartyl-peptidase